MLAITSTTNEALTDMRHPATRRIFDKAGSELSKECRQQLQCKSSHSGTVKTTNFRFFFTKCPVRKD